MITGDSYLPVAKIKAVSSSKDLAARGGGGCLGELKQQLYWQLFVSREKRSRAQFEILREKNVVCEELQIAMIESAQKKKWVEGQLCRADFFTDD
jgi:hypothetical protein